jgi:predicted RecB family endonuclease
MTEVNFDSIDDIHVAMQADLGKDILESARALADKFGVTLEVLVVAEAS